MPKRDDIYMGEQRTAIARAALKVLLEKGVYATSLRDICMEAGISIGALYTHFANKSEAITAACALDFVDMQNEPPARDWAAYVERWTRDVEDVRSPDKSRRMRVSLQFVAELMMMDEDPEGLTSIYLTFRDGIRQSLSHLLERQEITLPLGLEQTTEIHMQLIAGAEYQVAADRTLERQTVIDALAAGLAATAGLIEQPAVA
ncbi:MAG TPA: TetR family transcriptional regulator [Sphingobium sp.]|nr:TetR family transcriptional regulator [Sphingobium sp.]